ncbi:MAG: nonphosphorylating glyceraldehyde-3-phosphate dehydrogenase [Actinomycetia bacterium]|nr:nonphosphorylating glyceraldehyde-3-phosphate dehydrogenase [Actinomycetes bacterium]
MASKPLTKNAMFVDGSWTAAAAGETFTALSPSSGEEIGQLPQGSREDAQRAIDAANRASDAWARLTAFDRAAAMHRVADAIEQRRDELAHTLTLDQGKPLHESRDEVEELIQYWRNAAEDGKRLEGRLANSFTAGKRVLLVRRPRGVIGVITPWNWPYTMPAELIAPALASGNTVVWTPASSTAVAAVALAQCVVEADLPQGVFNLVTGPGSVVGDEIARNPGTHGVGFIGSTETGRKVAEAAAGKAAVLELGGNGPVVVLEDADLDLAAEATVSACFMCAGQSCTAGERLLVHKDVREEFVARVAALVAERVILGDPFADGTTMGPLNNAGVAEKMDEHVADALERGAQLIHGGERASGYATNLYWQPTVLDRVPVDSLVALEETFGPIAPVVEVGSLDEAIRLTNASEYGLLSAIFTRDLAKGLRFADEVRTGWVNINDSSNYWESHLPFGGRAGTASGIGRVGGTGPMESFTELQTVVIS